jgi:hypothetical protein
MDKMLYQAEMGLIGGSALWNCGLTKGVLVKVIFDEKDYFEKLAAEAELL